MKLKFKYSKFLKAVIWKTLIKQLLSILLLCGQIESKIAVAREFYYSNRKPVIHLETP